MKTTRMILAIFLIAGSGFTLNIARAEEGEQMPGIKRTDLQQHDLSIPG